MPQRVMPNGRGGETLQKLIADSVFDILESGDNTAGDRFALSESLVSMTLVSETWGSYSSWGERFSVRRCSPTGTEFIVQTRRVGGRRELGRSFPISVCSPIVDKLAAMHDLSAFSIVQVRSAAFQTKQSLFLEELEGS
jgi:hypothetical protein